MNPSVRRITLGRGQWVGRLPERNGIVLSSSM